MSGTSRNRPWTNGTPPRDKLGPVPGTNRPFLFSSTVKSPFCPVCPGTGGGSSLGRLSHRGRQKTVFVFSAHCCGPVRRFAWLDRSLRTLRARNRKKFLKRSFWGSAEKSQKIPENVRKSVFFTFSGGTFLRTPKTTFLRFLCDFGPGGSGDSCKWRLGSQVYLFFGPPISFGFSGPFGNEVFSERFQKL